MGVECSYCGGQCMVGEAFFPKESSELCCSIECANAFQQHGNDGLKFDAGKTQYSLVPEDALHEVARVLTFGAQKYGPDNWKKVPELQRRYFDALQRHLYEYQKGETFDKESGLHHLAHAGCCLMFMLQDNIDELGGVK